MYSHKKMLFSICLILLCTTISLLVFAEEINIASEPIKNTIVLSRSTMELQSNRHTQVEDLAIVKNQFDLNGFKKIAETSEVELWFAEARDTLRFVNRNTGYVWGTIPLEDAKELNQTWKDYASSIVGIECYDKNGTEKRYGLQTDTVKSYAYSEKGIVCDVTYTKLDISFRFSVDLVEDHVVFQMDGASLQEASDYKLKSLAFMPFLGTSYGSEINGYFLIPDGSGALLRFKEPASYIAPYNNKVYGSDLGIDTLSEASGLNSRRPDDYIVPTPQILMPIYGIVHGTYQNGLFAVVNRGDEYSSIIATPAGLSTNYNFIMSRFEFRQKYTMKTNNSGSGTFVPQKTINQMSPMLSIYITDGTQANYDGMAVRYREILMDSGVLAGEERIDNKIPMRLEILGSGKHDGLLFDRIKIFTTIKQAGGIVNSLNEEGISNLSLLYKNFTTNNEAGNKIENKIGTSKDFDALTELLHSQGGRLYYYINPISANKSQINLRLEAANTMSTVPIQSVRYNWEVMYNETYFYRISVVKKLIDNAMSRSYGMNAKFALDQMPSRLFGDYTRGKEVTRKQALQVFIDQALKISEGQRMPMYLANQYLWSNIQEMYDVPVVNAQFLYETDTVPFLEMVLKGSIDCFGTTLNNGTYSRERLLRYIEYGVYPSFITAYSESIEVHKTSEAHLFSTNFEDWKDTIVETYDIMNNALSKVEGKMMMEHKVLEPGVVRVTYQDGIRIYVNYTSENKVADGHSIQSLWYLVTE